MTTGYRLLVATIVGALLCAVSTVGPAGGSSSAACPPGSKRAIVGGKAKCLRPGQRCAARYQAAYRRVGLTCVSGRLRRNPHAPPPPTPEPPPPPAPPPAPPAQPGHYHGTTSQLEVIDFDVRSDGRAVLNLTTGQVNQGCTPTAYISGGGLRGSSAGILTDGTFAIDIAEQGTFSDGVPYTGSFKLSGRFGGTTATGTLAATLNFTDNGTTYFCGSGQQTWTATRSG
jgi:hypothetical protein